MIELDPITTEDGDTMFRDVVFLALAGFVAMVILMLPHINPPDSAAAGAPPPGNVIVEITWPNDLDTDVDLWVQAPGDVPVGYSNKGGNVFNLLRDDLGLQSDIAEINHEVSYSRGVPSGEYVVNLHLYRDMSGRRPIPVSIAVSVKADADAAPKRILATNRLLRAEGEELTAYRFALDEGGAIVPDSVHDLPKPLRSGMK